MYSSLRLLAADLVLGITYPPATRRFVGAIITLGALAIVTPTGALMAQADPASLVPGQTFRDCPSCPEKVVVPSRDVHHGFTGVGSRAAPRGLRPGGRGDQLDHARPRAA